VTEPVQRTADQAGERLDRFLSRALEEPRNQVQRWIREGLVTVDGEPATKVSQALEEGQVVRCTPPEPTEDRIEPEEGKVEVLYEDSWLVVINKPAGLVVHPGAGQTTGTLAHRLLAHYPEMAGVGGPGRPGIVHRLDQGTTGVMVIARTAAAYRVLSQAFAEREVEKTYLAMVYGKPAEGSGRIEKALGRHPQRRKEMTVRPGGRPALTDYRTLAAANGVALLEVDLGTGRTHQIRVHLKSIGHPLVGDPTYGERRWKGITGHARGALRTFPRPALHAWKLGLSHPKDGASLRWEAPVPEDILELWKKVADQPWPASD
jgi:23S rRNA pseudouridine1911/1915/1917 synthase